MSDKTSKKIQKEACCDQPGCCPSSEDTAKPQSSKKQPWWKITIFVLGILAIAGGISYSLLTRHTDATSITLDRNNIPYIGNERYIKNIFALEGLAWIQDLRLTFVDHDFVFVMLLGDDIESNKKLTDYVSDAVAKIEAEGTRVETLILDPDHPEFSLTMHRMKLGATPVVLAISSGGNGAKINGDITEADILQTYLGVAEPCVCAPGSGCCGGN